MDDLISRQAAIDAVYKCSDIFAGDMPVMVVKADAYEALAQLPSADVAPVRHGHWIEEQDRIVCSECGARFRDEIIYMQENNPGAPHRCLECGAIMYGGIEDE